MGWALLYRNIVSFSADAKTYEVYEQRTYPNKQADVIIIDFTKAVGKIEIESELQVIQHILSSQYIL